MEKFNRKSRLILKLLFLSANKLNTRIIRSVLTAQINNILMSKQKNVKFVMAESTKQQKYVCRKLMSTQT